MYKAEPARVVHLHAHGYVVPDEPPATWRPGRREPGRLGDQLALARSGRPPADHAETITRAELVAVLASLAGRG